MSELRRLCVFCGSSPGLKPAYRDATVQLAEALAGRGIGLVYGGAHVGLMGVLADSMLDFGGDVIGVIPRSLVDWEVAHTALSDLRVVETMHERKALMAELADGFIALPGGMGTLEEFCEALTWVQLGLHNKPCGVLNVEEFFAPLLTFFDHMVTQRFLREEYRSAILTESEPATLIDRFATYQPCIQVDRPIGCLTMIYDQVIEILTRNKASFRIYQHAPMRTVTDHQEQLPFDTARFLKVLAFRVGDARWVLVALKGEDRLDFRALADAAGASRGAIVPAKSDELVAVFGCEAGGVCPIPIHADIEVFLDRDAAAIDVAYTGSSRVDRTLEIQMADLIRIANPLVLPLRRAQPA
jgi:uncharacterized protein (TIGR00730 family)